MHLLLWKYDVWQQASRWQAYVANVRSPAYVSPACRQHKDEVPEDIFDMLQTFTDFMAFKEMFLEYRAVSVLQV